MKKLTNILKIYKLALFNGNIANPKKSLFRQHKPIEFRR